MGVIMTPCRRQVWFRRSALNVFRIYQKHEIDCAVMTPMFLGKKVAFTAQWSACASALVRINLTHREA